MVRDVSGLAALSEFDRVLLTMIQGAVPLVYNPFLELAAAIGSSEAQVLASLQQLKAARFIRKIGPVLEPARFGIASELVAIRVMPNRLTDVAGVVSSWEQVTHCYEREHPVNLWFAALSADPDWFEEAQTRLLALDGVNGVWRLPALRRFKVAVHFALTGGNICSAAAASGIAPEQGTNRSPMQLDRELLAAVETDLPLCQEPFTAIAREHGLTEESLLTTLAQWLADGRIRRYGALVSHLRLGIAANAMTVWQAPADKVEEVGRAFASSPYVSHCYERPAFAEFPFNLYAMVHGATREECRTIIEELSAACRGCPHAMLFSKREFKKSSPRYAVLLASRGGFAGSDETGAPAGDREQEL